VAQESVTRFLFCLAEPSQTLADSDTIIKITPRKFRIGKAGGNRNHDSKPADDAVRVRASLAGIRLPRVVRRAVTSGFLFLVSFSMLFPQSCRDHSEKEWKPRDRRTGIYVIMTGICVFAYTHGLYKLHVSTSLSYIELLPTSLYPYHLGRYYGCFKSVVVMPSHASLAFAYESTAPSNYCSSNFQSSHQAIK
jgi:hypothetical protein